MQTDTFIEVKNLSRYYGSLCAVNNIEFEVKRGEVLGFLGPNGAGKSTTMKMITGNLAPSSGQVAVNGIDLFDKPKQAKAHIGYLPEQPPLYSQLTVDEYLVYCAQINRVARNEISQAVTRVKQRCGLTETGNRLIANLSKGFQQRVGLAQAIIHSPDIVILDEPTVGLDPIQIREIRELIRELGKEHCIIISTHILPEVQALCDTVQIINKGQIVLKDSVESLARYMQTTSLTLAMKRPPALDSLSQISDIIEVEQLKDERFCLHYLPEKNPAEEIVKLSVKNDWGLVELSPHRRSLEDIFVDITTSENNHPDDENKHDSDNPDEKAQ